MITTNKYRGKYRVVCEFSIDTLEPIKEKISIIKEVLSQYDETRELFEDLNN